MATAKQRKVKKMADEKVGPMVTSGHRGADPLRVVVVGAGGTGGRLIPPLMQILKRGDVVAIVDGDHVEDRNLARQNFRTRDVGENKAEVMARRYRRDGIDVEVYTSMLTAENAKSILCNESVGFAASLGGAIKDADAAVILTEWDEFRNADWPGLAKLMAHGLIIDFRNLFTLSQARAFEVDYISLGRDRVLTQP